jgi:hypothetical protein
MMEQSAYDLGYKAAEDLYTGKVGSAECPYPNGSEDATEWYAGNGDFYSFLESED